jgi:hypothetical protein
MRQFDPLGLKPEPFRIHPGFGCFSASGHRQQRQHRHN